MGGRRPGLCRGLLPCLWLCALSAGAIHADPPSVEVRVDTATVTLGDPIRLTLRIRHSPEERPSLPPLAEWLRGFSPRIGEQQEGRDADGVVEQVQHCELRLYELGVEKIPPLAVGFVSASGDTLVRTSDPIALRVVSARTEADEGLRDVKPPLVVPGGLPLWLVALLAAAILALVVVVIHRLARRRSEGQEPLPAEPVDYAAEFMRIAAMELLDRGDFKTYYSLLADNLRRYLEQSLEVEAMEQTTTEIAASLVEKDLSPDVIRQVTAFLGVADLVKFARFIPDLPSARRAPEEGVAITRAVERLSAAQPQALSMETAPRSDAV